VQIAKDAVFDRVAGVICFNNSVVDVDLMTTDMDIHSRLLHMIIVLNMPPKARNMLQTANTSTPLMRKLIKHTITMLKHMLHLGSSLNLTTIQKNTPNTTLNTWPSKDLRLRAPTRPSPNPNKINKPLKNIQNIDYY
jgi:hypothetical protein